MIRDKYIYEEQDVIYGAGYTRNNMIYQDGNGFLDSIFSSLGRVFSRKAVESLATKGVEKIGENLTKKALQETAKKGLDIAVKSATDFAVDKGKELVKNKITEATENIFGKTDVKPIDKGKDKDEILTKEERENLKRAIMRIRKLKLEKQKRNLIEDEDDDEDYE